MYGERDDKGLNNDLIKISGSRKVNGAVQYSLHLIQRNVSIIKAMNSWKKKKWVFFHNVSFVEFLPIVSMKASKNFKKDTIVMRIDFQLQGVGCEKNCCDQTSAHKPKLIDVLRKKVTHLGKFIYNIKIQFPNNHKIFHWVWLHDLFSENWDHLHFNQEWGYKACMSVTCFQLSIAILP